MNKYIYIYIYKRTQNVKSYTFLHFLSFLNNQTEIKHMKNELYKKKQTIKTKLTENVKFHTNRLAYVKTNEKNK